MTKKKGGGDNSWRDYSTIYVTIVTLQILLKFFSDFQFSLNRMSSLSTFLLCIIANWNVTFKIFTERINKMWYTHRNIIQPWKGRKFNMDEPWGHDLAAEDTLSGINQSQKYKYYTILLTWSTWGSQIYSNSSLRTLWGVASSPGRRRVRVPNAAGRAASVCADSATTWQLSL